MAWELPELPYAADALEPHIDAETMKIHHGKHHRGYVDKLNAALEGRDDFAETPLEELLSNIAALPEEIRPAVRNYGGGHSNHGIFWMNMAPDGGGEPTGVLADALADAFGSVAAFREQFTDTATTVFGSGWVWLVRRGDALEIVSRPNQDSPYMDGMIPLLGLDVWEHASTLAYQNRRPEYVAAWWNVVQWNDVAERYEGASG